MNKKSLLITMLVAFITLFAMDGLIHNVLLKSSYAATKRLWRPEDEMMQHFPVMLCGQFLIAAAFTMIFVAAVAEKRRLSCTLKYAFTMGVFASGGNIIMYAVQPYPWTLVAKWCAACIVETLVLGVIVFKVYKPLPVSPAAQ